MNNFAAEPLFGIIISIAFYLFGVFLREKIKSDFINPLLLTIIGIVLTLILFKIPFDDYNQGGQIINLFLGPATASIAYSVFKQIRILKNGQFQLLPVVLVDHSLPSAAFISYAGSLVSMML